MPKISAATVAEHRARQRAALVRAAVDILVEQGAAGVTPAAVGARAGLARSSFYQYFPSGAALIAAIVEDSFTEADAAVGEALDGIEDPLARIDAYITAELRLAATGLHRPATALMQADLPPECRSRVHELHHQHAAPLLAAIAERDPADPELTARLIGGLLQAAMGAVEQGARPADVIGRTLDLIHHGIRSAG